MSSSGDSIEENSSNHNIKSFDNQFDIPRSILRSRSKIFKCMFDSKMQDSKSRDITLNDVNPKLFTLLLEYM